jgi:hypothetical protein
MSKPKPGRIASRSPRALPPWGLGYKSGEELAPVDAEGDQRRPEALRRVVRRVIETMRAFDAVPAGMKMEPESVYDNRFVLKVLGR